MCGIAGVIKFGDKVITEEMLSVMLVGNEHRGNDAAGIMFQQADGSIDLYKRDVPGWTLVTEKAYVRWVEDKLKDTTRGAFVHARGASKGNPRNNNNNHPMFAGQAAIIHNGVIRNDDHIFQSMKLERKSETDSDAIRAIVDKHGITQEAVQALGQCFGSGAICAIHPRYGGKVLIVRSGNPLNIAHDKDFLYFSSEKDTLHKFTRPWIKRFGIWAQENRPDVAFSKMADDTAWIIGPGGLEFHGLCKINMGGYAEPWRKTYEEYETRQKKWGEKKSGPPNVTVQPRAVTKEVPKGMKPAACVCGKQWVIPEKELFPNYSCNKKKGGCGKPLHDPEINVKVN